MTNCSQVAFITSGYFFFLFLTIDKQDLKILIPAGGLYISKFYLSIYLILSEFWLITFVDAITLC